MFQTLFICVKTCAMKAAVGPALWPLLSGADVTLRQRWAETPAAEYLVGVTVICFICKTEVRTLFFPFLFPGGPMCDNPKWGWDLHTHAWDERTYRSPTCLTHFVALLSVQGELVFTCEKRCSKKRLCGRHKCGELCCVVSIHWIDVDVF